MGKTSVISVRLPDNLLERMDATGNNRTSFIREAIELKLNPVKMPEMTKTEKREVIKEAKSLTDMVRDAMLQRLQQEQDLMSDMTRNDFIQLVARLLPKESGTDIGLEQDLLSLQESIDKLPSMEDISGELNRMKLENAKLEGRLRTAKSLLNHVQHKETFQGLMEDVYRCATEYVVELVARNSLPGLGDGGGLTERGYQAISVRVKDDLAALRISGKGGQW
jgi:predicted DNA-binding protein